MRGPWAAGREGRKGTREARGARSAGERGGARSAPGRGCWAQARQTPRAVAGGGGRARMVGGGLARRRFLADDHQRAGREAAQWGGGGRPGGGGLGRRRCLGRAPLQRRVAWEAPQKGNEAEGLKRWMRDFTGGTHEEEGGEGRVRRQPGALVRKSKDQKTTLDPPGQTFLILSLLRVAEERAALGAGGGM